MRAPFFSTTGHVERFFLHPRSTPVQSLLRQFLSPVPRYSPLEDVPRLFFPPEPSLPIGSVDHAPALPGQPQAAVAALSLSVDPVDSLVFSF